MCVPFQNQACDCRAPCTCGEILQLDLVERRMSSLKNIK
jgi:hypothetical protein